ncbi:nuclear transport factor 2 family protein [Cupriavidus pinatubonensis]|uniref:DUF4440 domain-containing protein n=1 Tax=Cupriavidus pinatubonensis TaxID=248026 RepID=A0ABN7ZGA6_9BURK|nr:nuclear transport factor 2 family protein [Cupriavidus pinatubonensis]CAG9183316.1 hypothetical protein LMG23994_05114 [Cupriavidus pinatubonensis]
MRKKWLLAACTTIALAACQATGNLGAQQDSGSVAEASQNLNRAMVDADSATLARLMSDELTYGHSGSKVDTKQSLIRDLTSGAVDFVNINITGQTVKVVHNTAVVRHTLAADVIVDGKPGKVKINVLQVWLRQDNQWRLLARQGVTATQ